jgi:hypothetical protein
MGDWRYITMTGYMGLIPSTAGREGGGNEKRKKGEKKGRKGERKKERN